MPKSLTFVQFVLTSVQNIKKSFVECKQKNEKMHFFRKMPREELLHISGVL